MKRILLISLLFFFFLVPVAFANVEITQSEPTPTPIDYQLPYPGLLPDNPLYFLKVLRDRLITFLIADPLKKAEFNLLQADKHAATAVALFVRNKQDMGESAISKGENYFEAGITTLRDAKKQGMDTKPLLQRFALSVKKHQELVERLLGMASGNVKKQLTISQQRISVFEEQVNELGKE